MRTITENDLEGIIPAFRHFCRQMQGEHHEPAESYAAALETAFRGGLTVDEILNQGNYERACTYAGCRPDCNAYIAIMTTGGIIVRDLKNEPGWETDTSMDITARCMREFFTARHNSGGQWNTPTARANLVRLIKRNSLQGIMDDALVTRMEERLDAKDSLNVFQYIQELLYNQEDYGPDNSLTSEQTERTENFLGIIDPSRTAVEAPAAGERDDNDWGPTLTAETVPSETGDETIYGQQTDSPEEPAGGSVTPAPAEDEADGGYYIPDDDRTYVSMLTPDTFKRNCVAEIVTGLSLTEIYELGQITDNPDMSLDEFITVLADGRFDTEKESVRARYTHEYINSQLYHSYVECLTYQNVPFDEDALTKTDFLTAPWDMRDDNTRRLQKIKDAVYRSGSNEDGDIIAVLRDLEQLYAR